MKKRIIVLFLTLAPTLWAAQVTSPDWPTINTQMRQYPGHAMPVNGTSLLERVEDVLCRAQTIIDDNDEEKLKELFQNFGYYVQIPLYSIQGNEASPEPVLAFSFTGRQFLDAVLTAQRQKHSSGDAGEK